MDKYIQIILKLQSSHVGESILQAVKHGLNVILGLDMSLKVFPKLC